MLPKKAVFGVHHAGAAVGVRESSVSWRRAFAHSGGGVGPRFLLATTSEASTLSERRRQSATLELDAACGFTDRAYFENLLRHKASHPFMPRNQGVPGFSQIDNGAGPRPASFART
jgi:hypothetical protein